MAPHAGPRLRQRPACARSQIPRGSSRWNLLSITLVLIVLLLAPLHTQAEGPGSARSLHLHVDPNLHLDNATYLIGELAFDRAILQDPGVVDVTRMQPPAGDLVVCPIEHGARGVIPSLAAIGLDCPDGERYEAAELEFGDRTWLQFQGTYRGSPSERASLNLISPEARDGQPLWFTIPATNELDFQAGANELRFSPMTSASRVVVTEGDETHFYNGTDWAFLFERAGDITLTGDGFLATLPSGIGLRLDQGALGDVERALDPRTLIDLQQLAMGPDAREAVSNATRHFSVGMVPHFQNAAIVGNINGTIGELETPGVNGTLIRGTAFELSFNGSHLEGTGDIRFVLHEGSLWLNAESSSTIPWILIAVLWSLALAGILIGLPWRPAGRWQNRVERALPFLAILVWDRTLSRILDVSALDLILAGDALSWTLRLATLTLVSFLLAWFLLYVPGRTILRRALPEKLRVAAPIVVYPLFLLYLIMAPGVLIEMASLALRL